MLLDSLQGASVLQGLTTSREVLQLELGLHFHPKDHMDHLISSGGKGHLLLQHALRLWGVWVFHGCVFPSGQNSKCEVGCLQTFLLLVKLILELIIILAEAFSYLFFKRDKSTELWTQGQLNWHEGWKPLVYKRFRIPHVLLCHLQWSLHYLVWICCSFFVLS